MVKTSKLDVDSKLSRSKVGIDRVPLAVDCSKFVLQSKLSLKITSMNNKAHDYIHTITGAKAPAGV